jgi:hypothetical protein
MKAGRQETQIDPKVKCLRPIFEGSASGMRNFRGHIPVHLRYGLMTRDHPKGDLVDGLQRPSFQGTLPSKLRGSDYYPGGFTFPLNAPAFAGRTKIEFQKVPFF